jgi:peptidoglycan/LPS O-acetylase OafA/YrhL
MAREQCWPAENDRPRLSALTGLRFAAAFCVLFAHASHQVMTFSDAQFWYKAGTWVAFTGMTLFFVLSGFVIHYNYAELFRSCGWGEALGAFAVARFARLAPLYFACLLLALATTPLVGGLLSRPTLVLMYGAGAQSWLYLFIDPGRLLTTSFYPHSWSISTELFFYLLYPLGAALLSRLTRFRTAVAVWALFVAAAFAFLWLLFTSKDCPLFREVRQAGFDEPGATPTFVSWLGYFCPITRFLEFLLGCLTAQTFLTVRHLPVGRWEKRAGPACLVLSLVVLVLLHWLVFRAPDHFTEVLLQFLKWNFLFAPPLAVLMFCCVRYQTPLNRWLDCKPVAALGEASYSIYLLQPWLLTPFIYPGHPAFRWPLLVEWAFRMAVALALVLVVALGTCAYIETPGRRWLRRWFGAELTPRWRRRSALALAAGLYLGPVLGIFLAEAHYRHDELPGLYFHRGLQRHARGEVDAAIGDYSTALRLQPNHQDAALHRALLRTVKSDRAGALADLDSVLAADPGYVRGWFERGNVKGAFGDWNGAVADYDEALRLAPSAGAFYQRALARVQ